MKTDQKKQTKINLAIQLNITILITFSVLILWGIFLVRDKLMQNSQELGTYLAQSYAAEEESRMSMYKLLMNLGCGYFEEQIASGATAEELQQWLASYFRHLEETLHSDLIDPYAVVDGSIIGTTSWTGDASYDYIDTEWYQKALDADGEIIFTDSYQDVITGKQVITLARQLPDSENVLAFDIFVENLHIHKNNTAMPEDFSYFLYDRSGQLMYSASQLDISDPEVQSYTDRLLSGIQDGTLSAHDATIRDLNGANRGAYYDRMDNGWLSVITIPVNQILKAEIDRLMLILVAICAALFLAVAAIVIRVHINDRKQQRTADIIQILGDSYYAIYRIDFEAETYETIKGSEDVRETLGKSGSYRLLIRTVRELVDRKIYEEFEESFSIENIKHLVKNGVYDFGGDYQRRFGDVYKWVNIRLIFNKAPGSNEVLLCFREIEEEKNHQIQQRLLLETSLEAAQQTARNKTMFFSNISHDMRTPLNAVIGLARLAQQNYSDPEKVRDYIEKIEQSGQQLLALINDILDMSKLEEGAAGSLDYKPMNLEQCVRDCLNLFADQALQEHKKLQFHTDIRDTNVLCDSFRLNQIINNLISNALKYSKAGATITVGLRQIEHQDAKSRYQLMVKDTGIGMSKEFLEKIFEPFARETRFSPTKVTGTGLGMPIVKNLVQQMNGELTVQSTLGKGSTFTITLPLHIVESKEVKNEKNDVQPYNLQGKKILLAEDNEINMEIAVEFLTMLGAEVTSAWNGREAVETFLSSAPGFYDFILMDMQMPEMDGCTACREIRAADRPDAQTIPVIAVTANAFAEDIAQTTDAGMNGHISKPIDFNLLLELLQKLEQPN